MSFLSNSPSPDQIRLWQSSFPLRAVLCYGECSALISNGYFSPAFARITRAFSSDLHCENLLVGKIDETVGGPQR